MTTTATAPTLSTDQLVSLLIAAADSVGSLSAAIDARTPDGQQVRDTVTSALQAITGAFLRLAPLAASGVLYRPAPDHDTVLDGLIRAKEDAEIINLGTDGAGQPVHFRLVEVSECPGYGCDLGDNCAAHVRLRLAHVPTATPIDANVHVNGTYYL
jgi:hypothetical protein